MKSSGFEIFAFSPAPMQNIQQRVNEHTRERILQNWNLSLSLRSLCFATKLLYIEFLNRNQKEDHSGFEKSARKTSLNRLQNTESFNLKWGFFGCLQLYFFCFQAFHKYWWIIRWNLVSSMMEKVALRSREVAVHQCSYLFSKIPAKFPA